MGLRAPRSVKIAAAAAERDCYAASKKAVRLALPGVADAVACEGCPPLARLFQQFAEGGGELLVCPICFNSKKLDEAQLVDNARLAGATPLWQWIGEGAATVFSY
jgi:predicted peroxiredoxin